ncbi:hypothetical protein Pan44_24870 [Caulifigura coniformis]|uniref:DUF1275 domain-containing protein n=1 Tax=Caulifigura coniformis TaxID=2527983 RepID=A0A517SEA5_9PLAN|nr:YoaK family protein [Caulifigura coniformis]QDT54454.1 hypothetical protein Pan44_24870 [Caulifigura coniformis]
MVTTLHTPETIYAPRHLVSWMLLAAAAGAVNGFAFMTCEQFVTHLSGLFTEIGRAGVVLDSAAIVASFIGGAFASVLVIHAHPKRGDQPRWATPLIIVAMLLIAIAVAGQAGMFGQFGGSSDLADPPVALLSLLAFAMGLQNAAVASTTGLAVRTTHLTGPATDLGISLGTAMLENGKERRSALRGAGLRAAKIMGFATGAGLSVPISLQFHYLALFVPAVFVMTSTALSYNVATSPSAEAIPTSRSPGFALQGSMFRRSK